MEYILGIYWEYKYMAVSILLCVGIPCSGGTTETFDANVEIFSSNGEICSANGEIFSAKRETFSANIDLFI